jgi:hypothetical protein
MINQKPDLSQGIPGAVRGSICKPTLRNFYVGEFWHPLFLSPLSGMLTSALSGGSARLGLPTIRFRLVRAFSILGVINEKLIINRSKC